MTLSPVTPGWFHCWRDGSSPSGLAGTGPAGRALAPRIWRRSHPLSALPIGFVAFDDGVPVGAAALRADSLPSHGHLSPWATGGYVVPERWREGIGAALLAAIMAHASDLGYPHIYCGTSSAISLLQRCGWSAIDTTDHDGDPHTVFRSPS